MILSGTSRITTDPAATTTLFPIVTPGQIVTFPQSQTSLPIVTGRTLAKYFLRSTVFTG